MAGILLSSAYHDFSLHQSGANPNEHLAALADKENARVAAFCDISAARAEAIAERSAVNKWYHKL